MMKVEILAMRLRSGKSSNRSMMAWEFLRLRHVEKVGKGPDNVTSVNSIDEMLGPENAELSTDAWRAVLDDRIAEILDRKRSSVQGRERCLAIYTRILTTQFAQEEIRGKEAELVSAFLKSIKSESSEKETVLAIKGNALRNLHLVDS